MADTTPVILPLDKGLDTVTPPIAAEPGSLIDCVNYEMLSTVGYRRIDGFERYDGWVNGDIADYYTLNVTINDGTVTSQLAPGATIVNRPVGGTTSDVALGVVLSYASGVLVYAPTNKDLPIITSGTGMAIYPNTNLQLTATSTAAKGSATDSASTFVTNLRNYSATLRALVVDPITPIAGLHWMSNNLIVFQDAIEWVGPIDSASRPQSGQLVKIGTNVYRVLSGFQNNTTPPTGHLSLALVGTDTSSGSGSWGYDHITPAWYQFSTGGTLSYTGSNYAYPCYMGTPEANYTRGLQPIHTSFTASFTGGKDYDGGVIKNGQFVTVKSGTATKQFIVVDVTVTSGSFVGNNAAGRITLIERPGSFNQFNGLAWPNWLPRDNDLIIDSTKTVLTLTGVSAAYAAGTLSLRGANTRYVGRTYNFYGQRTALEAYIADGWTSASFVRLPVSDTTVTLRNGNDAFAIGDAQYAYWGKVYTGATTDNPRYVSIYKGNKLALGFRGGSVMLSAVGTPLNFSGLNNAVEIATGDYITGLLESQGDSLLVFGRRAIRRLSGGVTANMDLTTIVPNSGCFDYTALNVGSTAAFCGPAGISTIEQSAAYGDFTGERMTYKVQTTLLDKLVPDRADSDIGGTAMAMVIRSKDQYRLWLGSGQVVCLTLTKEGPKLTYLKYGLTNDVRVPFAWSSEISESGKERVHVVWDAVRAAKYVNVAGTTGTIPSANRVYELERGWGFDGQTFRHYFDVGHSFVNAGQMFTGIEEVRLHGAGNGLATLNIRSAGIEQDYDQSYHTRIQDISLPESLTLFTPAFRPVTNVIDQANWGLGVKLRIEGTNAEGLTNTEPSHICQVIIMRLRTEGAEDHG